MEIVIILKLLLIDLTGKVWAHFPSGPRIYNILRHPTQAWECFYHSDNFIPVWPVIPIWRIECSPQWAHHLTQPKIDISCQFIKCLSLTPESSFAFHPSFSARTGSPTKSSSLPVNYRWRWWLGFLIKLSVSSWQLSLYRPVSFLAILPAPSDICDPGPGRGDISSPSDGDGWRRQTESDGGPLRGDGRALREPEMCRQRQWLRGATCTRSWELGSNLSVHSVNPGEQGAGWHLYIRSEHNMSRNDPEITWVKMCLTSQFMNWRHETESQDLWSHCHDLCWEGDRSPDCSQPRNTKTVRNVCGESLPGSLYDLC